MVRLDDLHADEQNKMRKVAAGLPRIEPGRWLTPPALSESTVAIVTTSGIHRRQDPPFRPGLGEYRIIPADVDTTELTMSHISVNFDRTAFQQDPNVWFPLDRLRELEADGEIGGVSRWHYAFMGGIPTPMLMEETGQEVGRFLHDDGVDVALLVPV
ncbi:MAG: glycine/sarcosine/betaine reductase selenoprotein B family protein [Acidimicrobiales bacterium]